MQTFIFVNEIGYLNYLIIYILGYFIYKVSISLFQSGLITFEIFGLNFNIPKFF